MSFLLLIHSYPGANETVKRHWPYFLKSGASRIIGVGTTDGGCEFPCEQIQIGENSYMKVDGSPDDHLCRRLRDTIQWALMQPEEKFVICEYDVVFFKALPEFDGVAAHQTGGRVHNSISPLFMHNPWGFDRIAGHKLLKWMEYSLAVSTVHPNNSPDIFFGLTCDMAGIQVTCPWEMFTRNTLDHDLDLAQEAVRNGAHCVHGVKSEQMLSCLVEAFNESQIQKV